MDNIQTGTMEDYNDALFVEAFATPDLLLGDKEVTLPMVKSPPGPPAELAVNLSLAESPLPAASTIHPGSVAAAAVVVATTPTPKTTETESAVNPTATAAGTVSVMATNEVTAPIPITLQTTETDNSQGKLGPTTTTATTTARTGGKRKKKTREPGFKKAPQAPKRFKSAYILFSMARIEEYKRKMGGHTKVSQLAMH